MRREDDLDDRAVLGKHGAEPSFVCGRENADGDERPKSHSLGTGLGMGAGLDNWVGVGLAA